MAEYFDLSKTFSCNYCHDILSDPVILPCSEPMCKKHVEEMKIKSNNKSAKINCPFCNKEHITPEKGFPKDIRMAQLIANNFHKMDLGEAHKKAVRSCKELQEMINKMKYLVKEPENFIDEYFNKIINEIDLLREENKQKIDQWHEKCFNEIQKYKNECIQMNLCILNLKREFTTENQNFEDFDSNLQFWEKKLQIPELSNENYSFQNIHSNVDSSCLILAKNIQVLKDELLLNQKYELEGVNDKSCQDLANIKAETKDCGNCSQNLLKFFEFKISFNFLKNSMVLSFLRSILSKASVKTKILFYITTFQF